MRNNVPRFLLGQHLNINARCPQLLEHVHTAKGSYNIELAGLIKGLTSSKSDSHAWSTKALCSCLDCKFNTRPLNTQQDICNIQIISALFKRSKQVIPKKCHEVSCPKRVMDGSEPCHLWGDSVGQITTDLNLSNVLCSKAGTGDKTQEELLLL